MKRWTKLIVVNCVYINYSFIQWNAYFSISTVCLQCFIDACRQHFRVETLPRFVDAEKMSTVVRGWLQQVYVRYVRQVPLLVDPHTPDVSMATGLKLSPEFLLFLQLRSSCCRTSLPAGGAISFHLTGMTHEIHFSFSNAFLLWSSAVCFANSFGKYWCGSAT